MDVAQTYLDLDILINGGMDTLLLILIGRLIRLPIQPYRILVGAMLGEIPVILACYSSPPWTTLSKWVIPFLMIGVAYPTRRLNNFLKAILGFWLLSAGLGGFVYALWGWVNFDNGTGSEQLTLVLGNLWILPLAAMAWWLFQFIWQRWQERNSILEQIIYDLEIRFGGGDHEVVRVKALMDTGNQLRDPLTGNPVILLEEEVAASAMPENVRAFLNISWKDCSDPWPLIWKTNPSLMKQIAFIPCQTIDRQSWLLGIRPERVTWHDKKESCQIQATVALVKQVLSSEGEYQALLHPEHVRKGGDS
ncbi:Sporulation sigma-E factor processing peptidase (SpoIIGA) [Desulfosporosinus sp. I2]|uniref:sigma-E processing peptidase SpoIIGA n=1 Tax=Desulfosporosinus sp. I2 TaxID=1617025 RepID=UPI0005F0185E|nr:sigma-E processing peptidase SpoIIGA [Desulfosporosinus sp. I2]KJR48214.1 Sporulation sigma-E factor processing peptidase (SpoIIGA) [Desulfosporosinus sp. I2]